MLKKFKEFYDALRHRYGTSNKDDQLPSIDCNSII